MNQKGESERTLLRIDLADVSCLQLVLAQLSLFLHPLLVALGKANELLHLVYIVMALLVEVIHLQSFSPHVLVQVHQHVLLQSSLPVVDRNAVVVAIQAVDESLDRGLVQVSQVRCCLARLLTHHNSLGLNETEGINDDLALHGLNRVDDDGDGARSQLLEGLLGVDIDRREPAAETGMRVVPANNSLWPMSEKKVSS